MSFQITHAWVKIHSFRLVESIIESLDVVDLKGRINIYTMKEVTVKELATLKSSDADFQLIDVREPNEFEIAEIGGELIPMNSVPQNVDKFSKDKQVIVHCRSGKRSGDVINWLEANHGFENLFNLKGGILAWADEIDSSVQKY